MPALWEQASTTRRETTVARELECRVQEVFRGSACPLAILGASLFWLWMDAGVFSQGLVAGAGFGALFVAATAASVAVLALLGRVRWSEEGGPLGRTGRLLVKAGAPVGTLGSLAALAGGLWGSAPLLVAGSVLVGVALAPLTVAWGWVCCAQGHGKTIVHIASAWTLTLPGNLLVLALPQVAAGVVVALLPAASGALFMLLARLQGHPGMQVTPRAGGRVDILEARELVGGVDRRLLLLTLMFCFGFGLMYMMQAAGSAILASEGAGPAAISFPTVGPVVVRSLTALLVLTGSLTVMHDRIGLVFKACFYLMLTGLLFLLLGMFVPDLDWLSISLVAAGYCGFDVLVWTMVAFHGYVSPNAAQKTVVVAMLAEQTGIALGFSAGMAVGTLDMPDAAKAVLMVGFTVLTVAVLVSYTERGSKIWELLVKTSLANDAALATGGAGDLAAFKAAHRLTEREGDVLALLVQGRSFGYIAERMYVSENTVKTHVRHIYAKCGAHGKQDLLDQVERERSEK